jgi:serine/threonine protein kinase
MSTADIQHMAYADDPTVAALALAPTSARTLPLQPGHLLGGRYRILEPLGLGGMSVVYRAVDVSLRRPVAIKVFDSSSDELDIPGLDDAATRITREIRSHAALRHSGIVQLYDAALPGPELIEERAPFGYLVLEFAAGGTLAQRLRESGRGGVLSASEALQLGRDVADALAYLHRDGLAHCDVKTSNIAFDADGNAKLIDLGIAVDVRQPRAQVPSGWLAGTARYASPEQLRGRALTCATDVYSFGLVLLDSIAGGRPPTEQTGQSMVDLVPAVVPSSVGRLWARLLNAMLMPDPPRRPSADDVLDALSAMPG